ncbi:uncharacterized protein LOC113359596 [Papaver somniferum]|uniref:uncharacterized protein LOC113359596 n=1 Tax=Papaver somniferum TaxID=3469 RepID=UPI000E7023B5|nr:uncharacterized protein LOC113359596 [Papaver somniferum]
MDLFGPTQQATVGGKKCALVMVDDYTRFTWIAFLKHKNDTLEEFKIIVRFSRGGGADKTLFTKLNGKNVLVAQIYVDDIIYGSTSKSLTDEFINIMSGESEMSNVGELSYFLGLHIQQQKDNIFLSQEKYARNLGEKFELKDTTLMATPMPTTGKLQSSPGEKYVDQKLYRSMIGSLLYFTAIRPDIAFSVGCCAKFQANPTKSHLKAVKRIIRYVNGTLDYGLSHSMVTNNSLDVDWVGCVEDRKSTTGACFYVGQNLVA